MTRETRRILSQIERDLERNWAMYVLVSQVESNE